MVDPRRTVTVNAAGQIVVECDPRLEALFQRTFPEARVWGHGRAEPDLSRLDALGPIDVQVSLGSLPRFLRPTVQSFPGRAGYLQADSGRTAILGDWLDSLGSGLKVGIAWRSWQQTQERGLVPKDN